MQGHQFLCPMWVFRQNYLTYQVSTWVQIVFPLKAPDPTQGKYLSSIQEEIRLSSVTSNKSFLVRKATDLSPS